MVVTCTTFHPNETRPHLQYELMWPDRLLAWFPLNPNLLTCKPGNPKPEDKHFKSCLTSGYVETGYT